MSLSLSKKKLGQRGESNVHFSNLPSSSLVDDCVCVWKGDLNVTYESL